jgi:hypothetical protein
MTLWWLKFRGGRAVIIEGESLAHARLLVAVNELGRTSHFIEGYPVDPEFVEMIPQDWIGRKLSPDEASDLFKLLKDAPRGYIAKSGQQSGSSA